MRFLSWSLCLTALPLLANPTFATDGGNGVGNGGIAYVCRDAQKKITRAELVDLWEPITYKIERSDESVDAQIQRAIGRIARSFPEYEPWFTEKVKAMRSLVLAAPHPLTPTRDGLPNYEPVPGCDYEQVARYAWVNDLGQVRLLIWEEIFNDPHFSKTDQAALMVHEVLYAAYMRNLDAIARNQSRQGLSAPFYTDDGRLIPHDSRITRQVVQAAFHHDNAIVEREDLIRILRFILADTWSEFASGLTNYRPTLRLAQPVLRITALPGADAVCKFSISQDGRVEQSEEFHLESRVSIAPTKKWNYWRKFIRKEWKHLTELGEVLIHRAQFADFPVHPHPHGEIVTLTWGCNRSLDGLFSLEVTEPNAKRFEFKNAPVVGTAARDLRDANSTFWQGTSYNIIFE